MKFVNRETEYPGKRKLIKVDGNNVPIVGESPIFVNMIKDEGNVISDGTPIDADNLNKSNWRDDDSLSFRKKDNNGPFTKEKGVTQIITTVDGETWIVPPAECSGQAMKIVNSTGTAVKINGNVQQDVIFISDPQTQITAVKKIADAVDIKADAAIGTANGKSIVKVNGMKADINFTSDPQTQINGKADQTAVDSVSQNLNGHTADTNNPHSVTKSQIGLGNADNTSDANKPISAAQQAALNGKVDKISGVTTNEQLYCKCANGAQEMKNASSTVVNGAVPIRNSGGQIAVPAIPTSGTDAASKQYVDGRAKQWVTLWSGRAGYGQEIVALRNILSVGDIIMVTVVADTSTATGVFYLRSNGGANDSLPLNNPTYFGVRFAHGGAHDQVPNQECNYGITVTFSAGTVHARTWRSGSNLNADYHKVVRVERWQ